ncbi:MAG: glycosyltransferase 61 family protein [Pseudomonadota bacterium]
MTGMLAFDGRGRFGSREHFFHYMWGFLLPALHRLTSTGAAGGAAAMSCGPVMDAVTAEAFGLLGLEVEIRDEPPGEGAILLPRWDAALRRNCPYFTPAPSAAARLRRALGAAAYALRDPGFAPRPGELALIRRRIAAFAPTLLRAAEASVGDASRFDGRILLLKRAAMRNYYAEGGGAANKGYGAGRRSLLGVDEAAEALRAAGMPAVVFVPGEADFATQIVAFNRAAGLVAIRGAELANMVWMRRGARALVFAPRRMMEENPPIPTLVAQMAAVRYREVARDDGAHFALDPADAIPYFKVAPAA